MCGYADLLKILRDPGHEEHQSMLGWLGRPFDPEVFNRDSTNKHFEDAPVAQDNREPTSPRSHPPGRIQGIARRRKTGAFQLLIADIRDALADVARENRYGDLFHATSELVRFEDELAGNIGKVRELIAVGRAVRDATGPGRSVAEQKIIDILKGIAWTCCSVLEEAAVPRIPDLAAADALIPDLRHSIFIVAELRDYAWNAFVSTRGRATLLPVQDVDNLSRSSALRVACLIFPRRWTWPAKHCAAARRSAERLSF